MSSKQSWDTVSLIELIDSNRPITYGILKPGPDIEDGVPYVRVVDLQGGEVQSSQIRRTTTDIAHQYRRSTLKAGDVLMSIRGHVGRCGVVPTSLIGANITQDTARLAVNGKCDSRFLLWCLRSPEIQRWMAKHTKGVAVTGINLGDVKQIPIPLPTLSEQKRIAGILDQADGLRRKRQQALALTDHLAPSIFREMFGSRDSRGLRWSTSTVGDAVNLTNGRAFKSSDWKKEGLPIIRIQNLKNSDASFNYFDGEYDDQHLVEPGALLIAWAGQLVSFGVHLWPGPAGVLNQHIFKVTPKGKYSPVFLHQALSEVIERAKSQFHGIDMKHITKSDLVSHEIPNPPYEMQCEFARRVSVAESIRSRCFTAAKRDEQLFNSLVQRAFRGEL